MAAFELWRIQNAHGWSWETMGDADGKRARGLARASLGPDTMRMVTPKREP